MSAAPGQRAVLFDLDGTLTGPFVGITRSIQFALGELGEPVPDAENLRRFIGPPLQVTFLEVLKGDQAKANEAVRLYRQRYAQTGKFENELIPGIVEAVTALKKADYFLSVATSKLETYSVDIVVHFGLMDLFDVVHGSQLDGSRADKAELIRHIVETESLSSQNTIMIGDRLHDVHGAARNGIKTIGVLWGFGDREELKAAGAAIIVSEPHEIPAAVESLLV